MGTLYDTKKGFLLKMIAILILLLCVLEPIHAVDGVGNSIVSSLKSNSVNIGALLTSDSIIGKAAKRGIEAAVDDINADSSILRDTRLNLTYHDANCSGFLATVDGISSNL
ncbi:hypothetical protein Droror1_Dr00003044 [Drosera rotundifolia]